MTAIAGRMPRSYAQLDALRPGRSAKGRLVLLAAVLIAFPFMASTLYTNIAQATLLAVPGALALNMLTGVAGLVSAGNAAFMAIGAGVAGEFGTRLGWPFPAVVLLAGLAGGLIGLIVGLPSLRLRGVYLLVATLALQYLAAFGFQEFQAHTVGEAGFTAPTPSLFGFTIDTPSRWYYTLLVIAVLLALGYANLMRSTTGRAWLLIQERDLAAEVLGIDVSRAKIAVFVTSSFVIGLQGALYAYYVGVTTYDQFSLTLAISYVAMILIGGLGSLAGAIYGALFVSALPYILEQLSQHVAPDSVWLQQHTSDLQTLVYGLSIVIFLLFEPKGLVAVTGRIRASVERWPFGRDRQQEAREW